MKLITPQKVTPAKYKTAKDALDAITGIYKANTEFLTRKFDAFSKGDVPSARVRACYPYVRFKTKTDTKVDSRLSFGYVPGPGEYYATLTRPDIYDCYYKQQIELLVKNHDEPIEVGVSDTPMPIHFALGEDYHLEKDLTKELIETLPNYFDRPDLNIMDDSVPNCAYELKEGEPAPLSLFTAPRVDLSLHRLKHYSGTSAKHFQNFILYTNYQFYIDEFVRICSSLMEKSDADDPNDERKEYDSFVSPGDHIVYNQNIEQREDEIGAHLKRLPQMPAYHLKRPDGSGITMVNIGVGPSNAKTITDHVAVLRPHAWLMLGHCAGLRRSQSLGDYVLAHGYVREDHVLDKDLPVHIPIPALAEIQQALEMAVSEVIGLEGYERKKIMRTGTVATIDDRNWELQPSVSQNLTLSQSRAIALDMESATIAANGYRFRVPYGTLLCVSDKPLHGQLKLPGMADTFYRERVDQHLQIGLLTMALLRKIGPEKLHSRKLRSFNEVAFQ